MSALFSAAWCEQFNNEAGTIFDPVGQGLTFGMVATELGVSPIGLIHVTPDGAVAAAPLESYSAPNLLLTQPTVDAAAEQWAGQKLSDVLQSFAAAVTGDMTAFTAFIWTSLSQLSASSFVIPNWPTFTDN